MRGRYSLADLAGWAVIGKFDIVTAIEPMQQGADVVAGLVIIPAADILSMFRRDTNGPVYRKVQRIRPVGDDG